MSVMARPQVSTLNRKRSNEFQTSSFVHLWPLVLTGGFVAGGGLAVEVHLIAEEYCVFRPVTLNGTAGWLHWTRRKPSLVSLLENRRTFMVPNLTVLGDGRSDQGAALSLSTSYAEHPRQLRKGYFLGDVHAMEKVLWTGQCNKHRSCLQTNKLDNYAWLA